MAAAIRKKGDLPTRKARVFVAENQTPIAPIETSAGDDVLGFYGEKTCLIQRINKNAVMSVTAAACIELLDDMTFGRGIAVAGGEAMSEAVQGSTAALLKRFLANVNLESETTEEVLRRVINSYNTNSNAYLEMVRLDVGGRRRLMFYVVEAECVLLAKPKAGKTKPTEAIISGVAFEERNKEKERRLPLYPIWRRGAGGTERTLIHLKNTKASYGVYGVPAAVSVLNEQEIEPMIGKYNKYEVRTGRALSYLFAAKDITDAEAQKTTDYLNTMFTKEHAEKLGEAAHYLVVRADGLTAHRLNGIEDYSYYKMMNENCEEKIAKAYGLSQTVLGIQRTGRSLAGGKELENDLKNINFKTIEPIRRKVEKGVLNVMWREWVAWEDAKAAPLFGGELPELMLQPLTNPYLEIDPAAVLTANEQRELLGFGYLKELGNNFINKIKSWINFK